MLQIIKILSLVLFSTSLYSQWEVKNLDENINNNTINKLKFYNDSVGYAMGVRGLILRTEDMGESWQAIETDIEGDIADFDYSISGDIILTTLREKGTYKSTNGFDFVEIFPSAWEFSNIEYSPSNKFYLSGEETIYRSNEGEDWEVVYDMEENGYQWAYITDFSFVNDQLGYAVGRGNANADYKLFLLKSVDDGDNWEIIYENESFGGFRKVHFVDELIGYVLTINETWKTVDGGLTWVTLPNKYGPVDIATPTTEKLITVNRSQAYTGYIYSTVFLISESNDAGSTWTGEYRDGAHLETIQFINDSIGFVAGDYSLILKTENCGGEIGEDYPWYLFSPNSILENNEQKIEVFPNPTSDRLFVGNVSTSKFEYDIRAIDGVKLKHGYLSDNVIDFNEFNSGIYLLTLKDKESAVTFKIFKVD